MVKNNQDLNLLNNESMITCVIFDLDGVIINSEPIHKLAFKHVCQKHGVNFTDDDYKNFCLGKTDQEGFREIIKKYNTKDISTKDLQTEKNKKYLDLIADDIKPIAGVIKLIKKLANNFRLALTSSSSQQEIEVPLNKLGVRNYFEVIVSAQDVSKGKPDPQPYLSTAQKLNEVPQNCLVIEDTESGILSAKSAGMKCIAITTTQLKSELGYADLVIDDFSEINESIISNLN